MVKIKEKQVRDFLYVNDLSRAFEKFIYSDIKRGTWEIGGGKNNSQNFVTFVNTVGEVIGKKPVVTLLGATNNQDSHITLIETIKKDLDWSLEISIKEGIEKII